MVNGALIAHLPLKRLQLKRICPLQLLRFKLIVVHSDFRLYTG